MQKILGVIVGLLVVGGAASAGAVETADLWPGETWYVATDGVDEVGRGKSSATPFRTLQYAHDQAASGDTIRVAAGEYGEGEKIARTVDNNQVSTNRLAVSKKIRFISADGKGRAVIVGKPSASSTTGCGADAIRCVYVNADGCGTEFHGFGFRNGCATTDGDAENSIGKGGAVLVYGSRSRESTGDKKRVYLVDCVFTECYGNYAGGMCGGTAIRCHFDRCGGKSFGQVVEGGAMWNCVFVNSRADQADRPVVGNSSVVVNCTFVNCGGTGFDRSVTAYNVVFYHQANTECCTTYTESGASVYDKIYGSATGPEHCVSPVSGDFRVLSGSPAAGGGLTSYLKDTILLPEDTEMTDYYGNPIDLTSETCDAGAAQGAVTPVAGKLEFPANTTIDGVKWTKATYSYASSFPQFCVIRPNAAPENFIWYSVTGFSGLTPQRYLQADGTLHICHPPFPGDVAKLTEVTANWKYWVDANGDPAASWGKFDSSKTYEEPEKHPFVTLQSAMDFIKDRHSKQVNVKVFVKPGDYHEGSAMFDDQETRMVVPDRWLLIQSTDGAAVTVIRGKAATNPTMPDAYPGCGSDAVRCVGLGGTDGTSCRVVLQGFTFAAGHSGCANYSTDAVSDRVGGIYSKCSLGTVSVLDSVVTNCCAVRGGAGYNCVFSRCAFYDCVSYGGVFRYSYLAGCYVDPSCMIGKGGSGASKNAVLGTETRALQTTAPKADVASATVARAFKYSCAFDDGGAFSGHYYWGSVFNRFPSGTAAYGQTVADLRFVGPEKGDWRLWSKSAAITAGILPERGTADYGVWATNYADIVTSGLDGERIRITDGIPLPGCYQKTADGVWLNGTEDGVAVTGGTAGFNESKSDLSLTLSASAQATRACIGVTVNGATNLFAETPSVTIGKADVDAAGGGIGVEGVYTCAWYVNPDPTVGNDANSGFTPETPKRTLAAAMSVGGLREGDTVHAAEGTYAEGDMKVASDAKEKDLRCRVRIPQGVTLVADGAVGKTVILGGEDETPLGNEYGMGTNALKCVKLDRGAKLRGFTVTGGRSYFADGGEQAHPNWMGGGVYGVVDRSGECLVEDCVISNNYAVYGGGIGYVTAVNSSLFDNRASAGGGALYSASIYGCVVDYSRSGVTSAQAACNNFYQIVGCTLGENNRNFVGDTWNKAVHYGGLKDSHFIGNLVLGHGNTMGGMTNLCEYCVFRGDPGSMRYDERTCVLGDKTTVVVDDDLRPVIGSNPAVDAGNASAFGGFLRETDLSGIQRIYNGTIDIGALEADWRPVYRRDIARSGRFTVEAASPDAVETDSKTVSIGPGQTLEAVWRGDAGRDTDYSVTVKVAGSGVLTVRMGEDVREVGDTAGETTTLTFTGALASNALTFAYEGADGAAEIVGSKREIGALLIVR